MQTHTTHKRPHLSIHHMPWSKFKKTLIYFSKMLLFFIFLHKKLENRLSLYTRACVSLQLLLLLLVESERTNFYHKIWIIESFSDLLFMRNLACKVWRTRSMSPLHFHHKTLTIKSFWHVRLYMSREMIVKSQIKHSMAFLNMYLTF